MKRFKSIVMGVSSVALLAAFATPSLAEMSVIEDEELDEVTAAGQPKIAQAFSAFGTAYAYNKQKMYLPFTLMGKRHSPPSPSTTFLGKTKSPMV